jgi:hypothetical protein
MTGNSNGTLAGFNASLQESDVHVSGDSPQQPELEILVAAQCDMDVSAYTVSFGLLEDLL